MLKSPRNSKKKEIIEVAEEPKEEEHEQIGMEQIPSEGQFPTKDEMQGRRTPIIHSPPDVRDNFYEPAEYSMSNQGNAEIMEMLVSMKKEMEEREKRWEQQQKIREEFLEADFKRKEQQWERILKQSDEEWKEEMEMRER